MSIKFNLVFRFGSKTRKITIRIEWQYFSTYGKFLELPLDISISKTVRDVKIVC